MRITLTANTAWNILNFRKELVEAMQQRGATITVLAPPDEAFDALQKMGCTCLPLELGSRRKNPFKELALLLQMYRAFPSPAAPGRGAWVYGKA